MKVINFSLPSSDLASRKLAIKERQKLESYISSGGSLIKLDMRNVSSISESYSDELFGVLVLKFGAERVLKSINLINAKQNILMSVASVIKRRMNELNVAA